MAATGSLTYNDSVILNVPPTTGYGVVVFYRGQSGDPWGLSGFSSGSFAVSGRSTITVTAPSGGGEPTAVGDTPRRELDVDSPVASGEFSIWVESPSSGWHVGKVVAATGSLAYNDSVILNVPPTTGYRVYVFYRAQSGDPWGLYGVSSGSFSVVDPITVTAPTGTASYITGDSLAVAWTAAPARASGEFSIWVENPANGWHVGKVVAADGSLTYNDSVILNVPPTTGYRVYVFYRAQVSDPWGVYGVSPGTFTVAEPITTLGVTAPNGGENVGLNTQRSITWSLGQALGVGSFDVYVWSPTQGTTKLNESPVAAEAGKTSYSLPWAVTQARSADWRARIIYYDAQGEVVYTDDSNATFAIVTPQLAVSAPNGGEHLVVGTDTNVTWTLPAALTLGSFDVYADKSSPATHTKLNASPIAAEAGMTSYSLPGR